MNSSPTGRAGKAVCEAAPAKINLALHVIGQRPDGFHDLETLAVFCAVCDRVTVAPALEDGFAVEGPFADFVPAGADNLVLRARDTFFSRFGGRAPLAITLEKNLPASSGIGGGSSDAAAALRALARLFPAGIQPAELAALAASLGADVPMCLQARPLIARGVGERIELLEGFPPLPLVLVNPGAPVATPAVFRSLTRRENAPLPPLPSRRSFDTVRPWLAATRNDLQAPAIGLAPVISDVLRALEEHGAALARMSGSGATCFGLFASLPGAEQAVDELRSENPSWWVAAAPTLPDSERTSESCD